MSDSDDDSSFENTMAAFTTFFNPQLSQFFIDYLENEEVETGSSSRPKIPRRNIPRDHIGAANRLYNHYFAPEPLYPADYFRRRFRMPKELFIRVVQGIHSFSANPLPDHFKFFHLGPYDAVGNPSFNIWQKCTSAIRQLAYGCNADQLDEYLEMGQQTSYDCLENFCKCVYQLYHKEYLRKPTQQDVERITAKHLEVHGFPGMLGSIDCMHWGWRNCPVAWQGHYTRGDKGHPTIMLEVVASYDLWLWHAYFGPAGSNNDINVLNESELFDELLEDRAPHVPFTANGQQFTKGYYLADGIYPPLTYFNSFQYINIFQYYLIYYNFQSTMANRNNKKKTTRTTVSSDMWQQIMDDPMPAFSSSAGQTSNQSPPMPAFSSSAGQTSNQSPPIGFAPYSQPFTPNVGGFAPYSQPFFGLQGFPQYTDPQQQQQQLWRQQQLERQQQFDHWRQQQEQQFSQRTPPLNLNNNVPEWTDSVASADEEEEVAVATKKKGKKPAGEKRAWTDTEVMLLARSWVAASEDPVTGNSMTEGSFWGKVCDLFNGETPVPKRTISQIHGKWNKIKKAVKEFGAAFKKVSDQRRQSGADDKQVYDAAHKLYKKQTGEKKFLYEDCYQLLKSVAKFWDDHGVGAKRSAPAIDLEADETPLGGTSAGTSDPAMEALFRDDPIRRPPGRNVSRRLSSSSDATSGRSTGSEASQRVNDFVQQQSEALARFEISHAMNILSKPIPDGLSRKDYKAQMAYRKHLQEQFGNLFYAAGGDSDEDE